MLKSILTAIGLFAASLPFGTPTAAAPVTWTAEAITFADGGTLSGSFVFDAALNQLVSGSLTTNGGIFASSTYTAPSGLFVTPTGVGGFVGDVNGGFTLGFSVTTPFTDITSPASVSVATLGLNMEYLCFSVTINCSPFSNEGFRRVAGGSFVADVTPAIPLPAGGVLVLTALSALALLRRRSVRG